MGIRLWVDAVDAGLMFACEDCEGIFTNDEKAEGEPFCKECWARGEKEAEDEVA